MNRLTGIVLVGLALLMSVCAAQDDNPAAADPPYEFVSGTITDLPPGKIVITRSVLGKAPENRTFTVTGDTKIEGKLKLRARVTVGFKPSDEGEPVAMRIIVRPQATGPKKP